jgi:SAM-dependent methyltransferase
MIQYLLNRLREPSLASMDVDGAERLKLHRAMLDRKPMLRDVFIEFNQLFKKLADRFLPANGLEIELGAGVAPMRDSYPEVLATDVVVSPDLDRVLNAQDMNLADGTVRVFYGQNCFHHFPQPDQFFSELERTLAPSGGAILLEPYYGPLASFLYKRLFSTEGFDKSYPAWETPAIGPMNGANQALSYIVFVRDREEFSRKYPSLEIVHEQRIGNYLKYLLSGGLNFKQLLPDWTVGTISLMEKLLWPLNRWFALHHVIVLRKVRI